MKGNGTAAAAHSKRVPTKSTARTVSLVHMDGRRVTIHQVKNKWNTACASATKKKSTKLSADQGEKFFKCYKLVAGRNVGLVIVHDAF